MNPISIEMHKFSLMGSILKTCQMKKDEYRMYLPTLDTISLSDINRKSMIATQM